MSRRRALIWPTRHVMRAAVCALGVRQAGVRSHLRRLREAHDGHSGLESDSHCGDRELGCRRYHEGLHCPSPRSDKHDGGPAR